MKTKKYIEEMEKIFIKINKKQKEEVLKYFGENLTKELTKQDINEQTRKIMQKFEKF